MLANRQPQTVVNTLDGAREAARLTATLVARIVTENHWRGDHAQMAWSLAASILEIESETGAVGDPAWMTGHVEAMAQNAHQALLHMRHDAARGVLPLQANEADVVWDHQVDEMLVPAYALVIL